jgi:squalene-hopene/tetraprenyl-beta-curcumene cyclase
VRCFFAILTVVMLPCGALAADPGPDVKETINRGLTFLAKDNLAWKVKRKCAECHHAPFTIWALNEGKKWGYAVNEKALAEMNSWVVGKEYLDKLFVKSLKQEQIELNVAPLLLALGIEAGNSKTMQEGLKKMLASVLSEQGKDGSWKRPAEARPIASSPDTLTTLALLALSHPNAPDMGVEGKTAQERGLKWLRAAKSDDELQPAALRLILWRRLGLPATAWEPLTQKVRRAQNSDGGWSQINKAKSDAYATGQALYALAEAGVKTHDEAVQKAQLFLAKTQRQDGGWAMASRAILPSGKIATNLEPITHAGSAWAVMGLIRSSGTATKPASKSPR